jgi:hypothetical protein
VVFAGAFVAVLLMNLLDIGGLLTSIAVGIAVCVSFMLVLLAVQHRRGPPDGKAGAPIGGPAFVGAVLCCRRAGPTGSQRARVSAGPPSGADLVRAV